MWYPPIEVIEGKARTDVRKQFNTEFIRRIGMPTGDRSDRVGSLI